MSYSLHILDVCLNYIASSMMKEDIFNAQHFVVTVNIFVTFLHLIIILCFAHKDKNLFMLQQMGRSFVKRPVNLKKNHKNRKILLL